MVLLATRKLNTYIIKHEWLIQYIIYCLNKNHVFFYCFASVRSSNNQTKACSRMRALSLIYTWLILPLFFNCSLNGKYYVYVYIYILDVYIEYLLT